MNDIELEHGERVLAKTRKHWMGLLRDEAGTIAIGIAPFLLAGVTALPGVELLENRTFVYALGFAEVLWALLVWLAMVAIWTNHHLDLWVITTRRIVQIEQIGLFKRAITSWQIESVGEIGVEAQTPLQGILRFGTIRFKTGYPASPTLVRIEGVPLPEALSALILEERQAYGKLEETNKRQEALLHTVSHETKAHLTKNEAALAAIMEGDYGEVPEKLKAMVREALAETRSGVSMVTDLLSASDLKSGAVQMSAALFDFAPAVRKVCAELGPSARKKDLSLTCDTGGPFMIRGDEIKLREHVIRNLVDNAVRYTQNGGITIRLRRVENAVVLSVADSGVGIRPEDMPKLFTEGGKGADSTKVNPSSTGFGLFIAKQIAEAHGGALWAESAGVNKGSTFYLALPETHSEEKKKPL